MQHSSDALLEMVRKCLKVGDKIYVIIFLGVFFTLLHALGNNTVSLCTLKVLKRKLITASYFKWCFWGKKIENAPKFVVVCCCFILKSAHS